MAVGSAGIVTPDAVLLEFEEAGLATRLLALSLDVLIQGVVLAGIVFLGTVLAGGSGLGTVGVVLILVGVFLVIMGYPVACETFTRGRTVGKMALGLRVVTVEGAPVRFRHAFIRGAFGVVELYVLPWLGVITVLLNRRRQRLGDIVAGTLVLRERTALATPVSYTFTAPPGLEAYVASLDVGGLDDQRYRLIRSFLLRVWELDTGARLATAERLANATTALLNHEPQPNLYPEMYLVCVAAAYQARSRPASVLPPPPPPPPPGWSPPPPPPPPVFQP